MERISVAGDTRFDRVAQLPAKFEEVPGIEGFIQDRRCIVVGSVWPKDEAIVLPAIAHLRRPDLCWIIAPHEIHGAHIDAHIAAAPQKMAKYSQLAEMPAGADVLWIDNIGMLSRLYHDAVLVYIGGGFGVGIHNTQEPAVYGNPVIFGPQYQKFQEAVDLVNAGGAISVTSCEALQKAILHWLDHPGLLAETRRLNADYMRSKTGATHAILEKLNLLGFLEAGIHLTSTADS
jgi:3-deoxy-D-manno-octulosonic-acid transferase